MVNYFGQINSNTYFRVSPWAWIAALEIKLYHWERSSENLFIICEN